MVNSHLSMRLSDWTLVYNGPLIGWGWRGPLNGKPKLMASLQTTLCLSAMSWVISQRAHAVNMAATDVSRALDILRSLYQHVQTLEQFADSIVFKEGQRAVLVKQSDTNRFISFVRGVFICFDKELQQVPSCNQVTCPRMKNYPTCQCLWVDTYRY